MKNFIRKICFALTCSLVLFSSACFAALAPMPMAIGTSDGEWTYMGRFVSQRSFDSILEMETGLQPYTTNAENDPKTKGFYDVYFHHEHEGNGEGQGCYAYKLAGWSEPHKSMYCCIIKTVPLNSKGQPHKKSGLKYATYLFSMSGGARGAYRVSMQRMRVYDAVTHELLFNNTDYKFLNGNFVDWQHEELRKNSPYFKAYNMSNCPIRPYDGRHG